MKKRLLNFCNSNPLWLHVLERPRLFGGFNEVGGGEEGQLWLKERRVWTLNSESLMEQI
ncbi:hypothetical protein LguiA_020325 [Lonicera macranthoides]